ncbi:MAG: SDR family NAD(P)-dependent oxidoreductase [Vulcanimicrobiaceae bacterium]
MPARKLWKSLWYPAISLGVDLNIGHVAVSETDRFGNRLGSRRIALPLCGASRPQAQTAIVECVKEIIGIAIRAGKPVSIETLNFARKKAQLSYAKPKTQRMLSSFAYTKFAKLLKARAFDAGIEVDDVSPAYSSKIGKRKYARRYGLSVYLAAALVLARRARGFRDRDVSSGRQRSGAPAAARAFVGTVAERFGHVDVLVNNAGTIVVAPYLDMTLEDFRALMEANFFAALTTIDAVLPVMRKQGRGNIVDEPGQLAHTATDARARALCARTRKRVVDRSFAADDGFGAGRSRQ